MSMHAAIYARVSKKDTDENKDHDDDNKEKKDTDSVKRQIDGARRFITTKGWTLSEDHIFKDNGVSGALFADRERFQAMLRDAALGAFQHIVFFDLDRFGRYGRKSMEALYQLNDLDVTIWDFSTGLCFDLESFEGETMTFLKTRFAQQYLDQVRKHTREALHKKAADGFVAGCKVFGYDNEGKRGEKRRVRNDAEAAVVVDIYQRFASGEGYKSIAWALNAKRVPAPRAQKERPHGWSASTVRSVLDRELYRGIAIYGKSRKVYRKELPRGSTHEKSQVMRPRSEWLTLPYNDDLRIIEPALEAEVDARRHDRSGRYLRATNGQLIGRPRSVSPYLLSGLLVCPCGGRFEALKFGNWSHKGPSYVCGQRRRKGPSVCGHNLAFPITETDDAILSVIEGSILSPAFVAEVLDSALTVEPDRDALELDRARLVREIENLTKACALGVDGDGHEIPALVDMLKERQRNLKRVEQRLAPQEGPDRERLRLALEQRVVEWKGILRANPRQARLVLMQLVGPLVVEATPRPAWVTTPKRHGLLVGLSTHGTRVASPTGFEPVF